MRVGDGLRNLEKAAESQKNQLPAVSSACFIYTPYIHLLNDEQFYVLLWKIIQCPCDCEQLFRFQMQYSDIPGLWLPIT